MGQDGGTFVMSIRRLVFEGSAPDAQFVLSSTPSLDDVLILGDEARMYVLTGRHAVEAIKEDSVISLTGVGVPSTKILTYHVGTDSLNVLVPQVVLDEGPSSDGTVQISVNGSIAEVTASDFYKLVEGELAPEQASEELQNLAGKFEDMDRAANAMIALALVRQNADALYAESCVGECLVCGSGVGAYAISVVGLVLGCGNPGAPLTCAVAIVGHMSAEAGMIGACMLCADCRVGHPDPGEPECPPGYEPCAGDPTRCCSQGCGECCACVPVCECGCCGW
jgi:hypothetical protein